MSAILTYGRVDADIWENKKNELAAIDVVDACCRGVSAWISIREWIAVDCEGRSSRAGSGLSGLV